MKRILITGAASGFGKGLALALAAKGHHVIAAVQYPQQRTELLAEAWAANVEMEIIKLDITNPQDRARAFTHEIDILVNNAGQMQAGPVAEMPMERVRENFEVNVFGTLAMIQGFVPQMAARRAGKIVTVTSMGGLITVPFAAVYTATKHALEGLIEGLRTELAETGIEFCTANPGIFGTGFNDRGAETALEWFDPKTSLSKSPMLTMFDMIGGAEPMPGQLDPQIMVDALVDICEAENTKFRNVVPAETEAWIKMMQKQAWIAHRNDPIYLDPTAG
ncbi:SDR family oxidoreductase [Pseudodonghicola sp.]|uniref:SDR family oxidoreductase n=1 Tax=Pseudodonghicola sp. TaxID=1969463 RepID=UPI003A97041C